MKTTLFCIALAFSSLFASAQLSFSGAYNFTAYKGYFQRNTPGVHLRADYLLSDFKNAVFFGYTHGFPLKEGGGSYQAFSDNNQIMDVHSELKYTFQTFDLGYRMVLVGDEDTKGSIYILPSLRYVMVNVAENPTEKYDQQVYSQTYGKQDDKETGIFVNASAGVAYKIGLFSLFTEGGAAFAVGGSDSNVSTEIPNHLLFNTGVKFVLGGTNR